MCWDDKRRVAPCFGVTQPFSEELSFGELPTALSLGDSYFSNSSFLQGNRKSSCGWRYSELSAMEKISGFRPATKPHYLRNDTERLQTDHRPGDPFKTKQEGNRKLVIPAQPREPSPAGGSQTPPSPLLAAFQSSRIPPPHFALGGGAAAVSTAVSTADSGTAATAPHTRVPGAAFPGRGQRRIRCSDLGLVPQQKMFPLQMTVGI